MDGSACCHFPLDRVPGFSSPAGAQGYRCPGEPWAGALRAGAREEVGSVERDPLDLVDLLGRKASIDARCELERIPLDPRGPLDGELNMLSFGNLGSLRADDRALRPFRAELPATESHLLGLRIPIRCASPPERRGKSAP